MLRGERRSRPTYLLGSRLAASDVRHAMHDIYRCECTQKTIPLLSSVPDAVAHEPELLKSLRHERIVEVWEAQHDPDQPDSVTFVMPRMPGGSVEDALAEGHQFSVYEALQIASDVCEALHYLHVERQILHRDVKPGNALLDADRRRACLSDFGGSARLLGGSTAVDGHTTLYLDPEAPAAGDMTVQSDLYSLGLALHEMLNGPLAIDDLSSAQIEARVVRRGLRPVPANRLGYQPHVGARLRTVVNRLISQTRSSRPASASAVIAQLNSIRQIDWRVTGDDADQVDWEGLWPPGRRHDLQRRYEVVARRVPRGPSAGRWRLDTMVRMPGRSGTRRFGVPPTTVGHADLRQWDQFFSLVETSVAQNRAAS